MHAPSTALSLAAVAVLSACGGASSQTGSREPAPARRSDVVTMEELAKTSSTSSLYEALRSLRPNWFRKSPTTLRPEGEGDIVVYLDQSRLGGLESLRTIFVSSVTTVRYYSPSEAQGRFGLGHLHGAIQVITSR
ncbi:MAG TPA: hypothetical protein VFU41_12810 [Gemmatimonadales bacterium]|nr:hypothetical protein [Gemmatimonadales bacterium]